MKQKNPFLRLTLSLIIIAFNLFDLQAQFQVTPATFGSSGRTAPLINGVGIGNFPNGVFTQARFQVNNFYTATPNGPLNGLLFRSDGNQAVDNKWQFFTGTTATNTTEKGVLFTSNSTATQTFVVQPAYNHFVMQSTQGDVVFNVQGTITPTVSPVTEIMRVTRTLSSFYGTPEGRVSIGRNHGEQNPLTMFHIGDASGVGLTNFAYRNWMDVGTFYRVLMIMPILE